MADQNVAALSDEEQREAAKRDASILAEAEVIKGNVERLQKAQQLASEMALETANQSKAFSTIASRSLDYPKMERERAESENIAPSAGV